MPSQETTLQHELATRRSRPTNRSKARRHFGPGATCPRCRATILGTHHASSSPPTPNEICTYQSQTKWPGKLAFDSRKMGQYHHDTTSCCNQPTRILPKPQSSVKCESVHVWRSWGVVFNFVAPSFYWMTFSMRFFLPFQFCFVLKRRPRAFAVSGRRLNQVFSSFFIQIVNSIAKVREREREQCIAVISYAFVQWSFYLVASFFGISDNL